MIGCVEAELRAMRSGLHDIIPVELLSSLTPEVRRYVTNICRFFRKRWFVAVLKLSCVEAAAPALSDIFLICGRCILCHLTMRVAGICVELVIYFR